MLPPSVEHSLTSVHSTTYISEIPKFVRENKNEPVIIGVDEAGRGPCLGALVYGISYCLKSFESELIKNYEFDDSKKLTDAVRKALFKKIWTKHAKEDEEKEGSEETSELDDPLSQHIGYATTAIQAMDISSGMLKFPPSENYNLNEQSHDATIGLIRTLVNRGLNIDHIYIDTVGPPHTYQKKLENLFPRIKFTVAKKADSLYVIVSVASVVAKVTRDHVLENMIAKLYSTGDSQIDAETGPQTESMNCGSGYPSDPNTVRWLKNNQTPLFGWPKQITRFSWSTCGTLFKNEEKSIIIEWEDDFLVSGATNNKRALTNFLANNKQEKLPTLDNWYF